MRHEDGNERNKQGLIWPWLYKKLQFFIQKALKECLQAFKLPEMLLKLSKNMRTEPPFLLITSTLMYLFVKGCHLSARVEVLRHFSKQNTGRVLQSNGLIGARLWIYHPNFRR
jgi:hypothetical protein